MATKKGRPKRARRKAESDDALDHLVSTRRPAQRSGRKVYHPRGFSDEGGWLVRVDGHPDPFDAFVCGERRRLAGREDAAALDRAVDEIGREVVRRQDEVDPSEWWAVSACIYIEIYARHPPHLRKTAAEIVELARQGMFLLDGRPLWPSAVTGGWLARHVGERLERVTLGRGGGRGRAARRSIGAIYDALVTEEPATRAALGWRLLNAIQEGRGIRGVEALRKIVGGRAGPIRAALADLLAAGAVTNEGTERHPIFFARGTSEKPHSSRS